MGMKQGKTVQLSQEELAAKPLVNVVVTVENGDMQGLPVWARQYRDNSQIRLVCGRYKGKAICSCDISNDYAVFLFGGRCFVDMMVDMVRRSTGNCVRDEGLMYWLEVK